MGERSEPMSALLSLLTSLPNIAQQVERLQTSIERSATENRKRHDETLSLVRSSLSKVSSLEKRVDGIERGLQHVTETCDAILAMCQGASNDDQEMSSDEDDTGEEEEGDRTGEEDENMEEDQDGQDIDARLGSNSGMSAMGQGALAGLLAPGAMQGSSGLLAAFREFLATRGAQGESPGSALREAINPSTRSRSSGNVSRQSAPLVGDEQRGALLSALAQSLTPAQLISNANVPAIQETRRSVKRSHQDRDAIEPVASDRDYSMYRLDRKIRTVHLLWKEWYEGLDNEKPSIVTMDSLYKHTWRSSAGERK